MDENRLREVWEKEEKLSREREIANFDYLDGKWKVDSLPWDYRDLILDYLKPTDRLLDMNSLGGDFLISLNHPFDLIGITEGYQKGYELGKSQLEPLGVTVKRNYSQCNLPYEDGIFDLVHNRNSYFDIGEVHRVLKPGGYYITQQIGGKNDCDLAVKLMDKCQLSMEDYDLSMGLDIIGTKLKIIDSQEAFIPIKFLDTGAVVSFASIMKLEFPNFTVEDSFDRLLELERELNKKGFIEATHHRFFIVGQKPLD